MSIAEAILEILKEEMQKHGAKRLRRVWVRAGKLSMVVPDSLRFCFEVLVEGTELRGAELLVEEIPLKGRCHDCGREFESHTYVFQCPQCYGVNYEITDGQGIYISEIEID